MWTRKGLKQKAKIAVKHSYWKTVLAAFLFSLLAGGGSGGVNIRIQLHMPLQTPEQTRAIICSLAEVPGMVWAFFGLFAFILFAVSICKHGYSNSIYTFSIFFCCILCIIRN